MLAPAAPFAPLPPDGPVALTRIHSITKHSVSMRDADIDLVVQSVEALLENNFAATVPQLLRDSAEWIPIASLLNYSPLGPTVWPFGGIGVVADCLRSRASVVVELSGDGACVRKMPLRVRLRNQLEFLFADGNYSKDVHLQLLQCPDGYTPLDKIVVTYTGIGSSLLRPRLPRFGCSRQLLPRGCVSRDARAIDAAPSGQDRAGGGARGQGLRRAAGWPRPAPP